MNPLITILMPVREPHLGFLELALQSVFAQSSADWELIVMDDGDNGGALDGLTRSADRRVRVARCDQRGLTAAYNAGMRLARTPFVCSLHADDLLDARAIEIVGEAIREQPRVDYFHSARCFVDDDGQPLSAVYPPREVICLEDFKRTGPVKPLHCWRVGVALAIGGMDEGLGLHAADDYDFPWCMAEAGCTFAPISQCLYLIRDHRSHFRLTTHVSLETQIAEQTKIMRKHGLSEQRIAEEIQRRKASFLRQALYVDDRDREEKERQGFDIRGGWREPYSAAK